MLLTFMLIIMSSPFLFVIGDDCVTYHIGADDILGDVVDA